VQDYQQIHGVEICTGQVHQLIDADHPWPGQVTATCDQTHPDEFTTTVSSDPAGAWTWGGTYDGPLGISVGITKAPSEPGDYYLVAEPLDETFRRGESWKVDHGIGWPKPVVRFTVMGGVFLDENYMPVDPLVVSEPVQAFLRVTGVDLGFGSVAVPVTTFAQDGSVLSQAVPIQLTGSPDSGYTGPITFNPEGYVSGASAPTGPAVVAGLGQGKVHAKVNGKTIAKTNTAFPGKLTIRFMTRDGSQLTPPLDPQHPELAGTRQLTEIRGQIDEYAEIVHIRIAAENPNDPTQVQNWNGQVGLVEDPNPLYKSGTGQAGDQNYQVFYDGQKGTTKLGPNRMVDGSYLTMATGRVDLSLAAATRIRLDRQYPYVVVQPPYRGSKGSHIRAITIGSTKPATPRDSATVAVNQWVDERTYLRRRNNSTATWGQPDAGNLTTDWLEKKVWDADTDYPATSGTETDEALNLVTKIEQDFAISRSAEVQCPPGSNPVVCQTVHWNPAKEEVRYSLKNTHLYESGYVTDITGNKNAFANIIVHEARHCWQYDLVVRQQNPLRDDDHDLAPDSPPASALEMRDAANGTGNDQNPDFDMAGDQIPDPEYVVKGARERDAIRMAATTEQNPLMCTLMDGPEPVSSVAITATAGTPVTCIAMPDAQDSHSVIMHPAGIPIRWTVTRMSGTGDCELRKNGNLCPTPCITTSHGGDGTQANPSTTSIDVVSNGPAVCGVDAYHLVPVPDDGCPHAGDFPAHFMLTFN